MAIEIGEMDGKIGGLIIRLACGVLGIAGIVTLTDGLISWIRDTSAPPSLWRALAGDEPYCCFPFGRSVRMAFFGGKRQPGCCLLSAASPCLFPHVPQLSSTACGYIASSWR